MRALAKNWEDLHCEEFQVPPPFRLKTMCQGRDGQRLGKSDLYKVFVTLQNGPKLTNLFDYGTVLDQGLVTLEQHKTLFSILLRLEKVCNKRTKKDDLISDTPVAFVGNVGMFDQQRNPCVE